jgi:hypothetical protein
MSNHVIYDRIWESKKLAKCSLKAALAYPWIYLVADDWGRFEYLPRGVWGKVFGLREDVKAGDVASWLGEYRVVGLLDVYEVEGRQVGQWTRFVGPPPSRRRASLLPARDGSYDNTEIKGATRFHSAARVLRKCSPEAGSGKREAGSEKREAGRPGSETAAGQPPALSRSPSDDEQIDERASLRETVVREVDELAAQLAAQTSTDPKSWVIRASTIPAQNGRPAKSFDDPRNRGLPLPWLETTVRKLREIRDEAVRPVPL